MTLPKICHTGLEDLRHGVEVLIDSAPHARESVAAMIAEIVDGVPHGTQRLVLEAYRFAAWGGDPAPLREAYADFAAANGEWIGAEPLRRQRIDAARKDRKPVTGAQLRKFNIEFIERHGKHRGWAAAACKEFDIDPGTLRRRLGK